ncbi:MAG: hypothetical protein LGR52_04395 [Candidatus Thiosymbion ectosymbiont of Robbea hypermnestra]|nr:hypothetical protein [Candidatus Thiosymbion ectosymbiont of Robbea hypermnestra]
MKAIIAGTFIIGSYCAFCLEYGPNSSNQHTYDKTKEMAFDFYNWAPETGLLSDAELVYRLTSRDFKKSSPAAVEVVRRGDRLFEQLFALSSDQRYFTGRSLMDPTANMLLPVPLEGFEIPKSKRNWVITVEVAALYLISAIYHNDIHFARVPLLYPENPRSRLHGDAKSDKPGNTEERVERAHKAIDAWIQAWRKYGLDALRSQGHHPLSGSNLRWY